jgi:tryptophan-rich sensory protein
MFSQFGWIDFYDVKQRQRSIAILSWIFPLIWAALFIFIKLPLIMVLSGGIAGSVLLIMVVYATWLRSPKLRMLDFSRFR